MLPILLIVTVVAGVFCGYAYADDFIVKAECINGFWKAEFYDSVTNNTLSDVKIYAADGPTRPSGSPDYFISDESGIVISPDNNSGWLWMTKPGFRDKVIQSYCPVGLALTEDVLTIRDDFCRDYVSDAMLSILPDSDLPQGMDPQSIIMSFAQKLSQKDAIIQEQINVLKSLGVQYNEMVKMLDARQSEPHAVSCSLFCDSTNYEPTWAKSMGQSQAMSKCNNMGLSDPSFFFSKEGNWCNELGGHIMDNLY